MQVEQQKSASALERRAYSLMLLLSWRGRFPYLIFVTNITNITKAQLAWQVSTLQLAHFSNISCSVCTLITELCVTKTVQRFRDVCNTGGEERRMVDVNCRFKTFSFRYNPSLNFKWHKLTASFTL